MISKNGNISGSIFTYPLTYDMPLCTLDDGSSWARIQWLDITTDKTFFKDEEEANYCVDKTNRYSRMGIVDNFKSQDGKYEFMQTFPSLSTTNYNRWSQTSSPNETEVTGFEKIHAGWSSRHFAGIRYWGNYSGHKCIWNCDSGVTWYNPVGQIKTWGYLEGDTGSIPAPDESPQTSTELWVRIDNVRESKSSFAKNEIHANDILES